MFDVFSALTRKSVCVCLNVTTFDCGVQSKKKKTNMRTGGAVYIDDSIF